jgi:phosphatidylglycerol:prolipoprotein diacylglycerol transferase
MNVWVHNLSPYAIRLTETLGIRWYGLAYLSGLVSGYYVVRAVCRRGNSPMREDMIADFVTYCAIGVLAGGRIGYCLFYAPDLLFHFDEHFPFWGLLKVNEGGMASHGGILGVMLVCFFYARHNRIPMLHLFDLVVFGGSVGFFFGRIANFVNGELYGRAAPEGLKWAVKFPQEIYLWSQIDPNRLYQLAPAAEALGQLKTPEGGVQLTQGLWTGWMKNYNFDMGSKNAVIQTLEQMIAAIQAGNLKVTMAIAPVLTARYPSQLIQAVLEGLFVFLILCWIWRKPQKPGVVGACFGVLYSVARIVGEQFRMPDVHLGFQLWGLTRGQWLSVGLLTIATVYLSYVLRRTAEPMGGFSRHQLL